MHEQHEMSSVLIMQFFQGWPSDHATLQVCFAHMQASHLFGLMHWQISSQFIFLSEDAHVHHHAVSIRFETQRLKIWSSLSNIWNHSLFCSELVFIFSMNSTLKTTKARLSLHSVLCQFEVSFGPDTSTGLCGNLMAHHACCPAQNSPNRISLCCNISVVVCLTQQG